MARHMLVDMQGLVDGLIDGRVEKANFANSLSTTKSLV